MKRNCQVPNGIPLAIVKASGHMAAVAQQIAGVAAVAINVHLEVRHPQGQHGGKVFVRPDCMNLVIRSGRSDERGRNVARDRRGDTVTVRKGWDRDR